MAKRPISNREQSDPLTVDAKTIGSGIRQERRRRGMTLAQLSERTNLTIGTLSQIERGVSDPSLSSLRRIAWAFGVPMFQFLLGGQRPEIVVRRSQRRSIRSVGGEIEYQLVSGETNGEYEVMAATLRPGVVDPPSAGGHSYEETTLVIRGQVRIEVAGQEYELGEGDSIRIERELPHRYMNVGDAEVELLMVISPSAYGAGRIARGTDR